MGAKGTKNLALGRPPTARPAKAGFSRRTARALINKHHLLEKKRQKALKAGDQDVATAITAEISSLGGLERYQQASLLGQSKDRGGDSSKILLEWIKPSLSNTAQQAKTKHERIRMLEVGALSTSNACSSSDYFETVRIDLNSQAPGILRQDFMERPLPSNDSDRFDIISLSLVLNFVPEPAGRGDMLRRATSFLQSPELTIGSLSAIPAIFLVLPKSCVLNSRYCSEELLGNIMASFGLSRTNRKVTGKLFYSLWRRDKPVQTHAQRFPKKEINPGPGKNNFAIVVNSLDESGKG